MTRAVRSHLPAHPRAPAARFGAALAASAFAHGLLLSALPPDLQWRDTAPGPDGAPITVRLAPAPVRAPDIPAKPDPKTRRPPSPVQLPAGASADAHTLPVAPDPNYYPARELDDYPRPLTPLRVDWPARDGAGEVRMEILIDERGIVREVVFAGAVQPGGAEEELRAMLAATPFFPALKGGRAVRSRILLRLDPGAGEREP